MDATWIDIPGYEGLYQVNYSMNLVRRILGDKYRELSILKKSSGHMFTTLTKDGRCKTTYIHQMVMWVKSGPCPKGYEICHNDGDATNNYPDNLRYGTRSENMKDKFQHGYRSIFQTNHPKTQLGKLSEESARSIPVLRCSREGEVIDKWPCAYEVQRSLGIHQQNISKCLTKKRKTAGGYRWVYAVQ